MRPSKPDIQDQTEPDPNQEYVPPDVDPNERKEKLIDLANRDVLLCARTLSRMRIWEPLPLVGRQRKQRYEEKLQPAPMDWWEYYSNIRVEQWIFMWVQAVSRRLKDVMMKQWNAVFQYYLKGPYTIRDIQLNDKQDLKVPLKAGREVKGSFVDFAWLPSDKRSSKPIVLLECDENAHYTAGWDAERYREVFVFRELKKRFPNNQSILLIRLNPHEYVNIPKSNKKNLLNVYTTLPKRDDRMANIRDLVLWGLGNLPGSTQIDPIKPGITIAFAYYDRWYEDTRPVAVNQDIHYHHFDSLRDYLTDVNRAAGILSMNPFYSNPY